MFLVYVESHRGPQPQKVPELVPNTHNGMPRYLTTHQIEDSERGWPIDALASKYPGPKGEANAD